MRGVERAISSTFATPRPVSIQGMMRVWPMGRPRSRSIAVRRAASSMAMSPRLHLADADAFDVRRDDGEQVVVGPVGLHPVDADEDALAGHLGEELGDDASGVGLLVRRYGVFDVGDENVRQLAQALVEHSGVVAGDEEQAANQIQGWPPCFGREAGHIIASRLVERPSPGGRGA